MNGLALCLKNRNVMVNGFVLFCFFLFCFFSAFVFSCTIIVSTRAFRISFFLSFIFKNKLWGQGFLFHSRQAVFIDSNLLNFMNSIRTPTQVKTSLRGIKPDSNFIMDKKNPKRKTIYLWLIIELQ